MNRYHNLQIRFPADSVAPGMELSFGGGRYTLGAPMPKTLQPSMLPISVITNGSTEQFQLVRENQIAGAAWFYFYGAIEGSRWAVLDEAELA